MFIFIFTKWNEQTAAKEHRHEGESIDRPRLVLKNKSQRRQLLNQKRKNRNTQKPREPKQKKQ